MARYIAFEGAEGCGKSSHATVLAEALGAVRTQETGGTRIGQLIRGVLHDTANTDLVAKAEALLIAADRAQHLAEVVEPALERGQHVVSDRSIYSSLAYQAYGRGLPFDEVRRVNDWALGGRWPDLVILLDVPADVLSRRMAHRTLDRFEIAGDDFHARVAAGFREMAEAEPDRWVVIDANRRVNAVAADIRAAVTTRLAL